nr:hypothetical protein [Mesorhizobium sp. WSM2561]
MIKLFRAGGTVSSLMDRKRGRRRGHRVLDKDREALVRRTIEGFYLKQTRPILCAVGSRGPNRLHRGGPCSPKLAHHQIPC